MGDRVLPRRKLVSILRRFGVDELMPSGGSSHRQLVRIIEGKKVPYTLPFRGDSADVRPSVIKSIRARFRLGPEYGVSDEEFYGTK